MSVHARLAVAACACLLVACSADVMDTEGYASYRSVSAGVTEARVRGMLGAPFREHGARTAPDVYCVSGYSCERRDVRGKLLIYKRAEPILYVFIDVDGVVEHTFVGGS